MDQIRIGGVKFSGVGTSDLVHETSSGTDKDVLGLGVPAEVVDLLAAIKHEQADGLALAELEMSVNIKEENLAITGSSYESHLVGCIFAEVDGAIMSLHHHCKFNVGVTELDNTNDTSFEADNGNTTLVLLRAA